MKGMAALIVGAIVTITVMALIIGHGRSTAKVAGAFGTVAVHTIEAGSLQPVGRGA